MAGIPKNKIIIVSDVTEIYEKLNDTNGNIYAILNLGTDKKFIKELEKNHIEIN